jgi:hypothetical protein
MTMKKSSEWMLEEPLKSPVCEHDCKHVVFTRRRKTGIVVEWDNLFWDDEEQIFRVKIKIPRQGYKFISPDTLRALADAMDEERRLTLAGKYDHREE